MSARPACKAGMSPLKSMSIHSTFLPIAPARASTSSMSNPVRLPSLTNSIGGKVASVTARMVSWACAAPALQARPRVRAAVSSVRRVVMVSPMRRDTAVGTSEG
ncbi:hypothetical protein D3C81_1956840 [compost metagenome]